LKTSEYSAFDEEPYIIAKLININTRAWISCFASHSLRDFADIDSKVTVGIRGKSGRKRLRK
jgi:hypothetical protein